MSSQPSGSRTRLDVASEDALKSPRPGHHLYLSRPLNGNGSSVSVNEVPPTAPHTPSGLRAHLGHLLPRHTYFRAKVTIHQISSVPFVGGEFGVRWKFKGVQTPSGQKGQKPGLFDRVKSRAAEKRTASDKGKAREDPVGEGIEHNAIDALGLTSPGVEDVSGHAAAMERQKIGFARSASGPAAVGLLTTGTGASASASTNTGTSIVGMSRADTSSSQTPSVSSHSSDNTHSSQHLSVDWGTTSTSSNTSGTTPTTLSSTNSSATTVGLGLTPTTTSSDLTILNTPALANASVTPARGMTPYLKLKDHSVVWSHTLDTVLRLDVDRETSQLAPCPLKLVVLQRVVPDDPHGSPQNPRLGAVYLNLSEYVGQGPVERRYLLRESKTNATLKLTIEMEYISGETHYIPPPLAKGEILTGIAGFLDKDIVKRRPRALDVYGPYNDQEELELDLLGTARTIKAPRTARSTRAPRGPPDGNGTHSNSNDHGEGESDTENDNEEEDGEDDTRVPFDVQKLPFAYGTKTTEALIDALFNPVITHEKREESPFTIYQPPPSPSVGASTSRTNSRKSTKSDQSSSINHNHHSGLGLSGVPSVDRNGAITAKLKASSRQGSLASSLNESSGVGATSVYSTSSSSASIRTTTSGSESSKARSTRENSLNNHEVDAASVPRGVPEGRVVVDPAAAEELQIGGIRGWWRRHTGNRPATPVQRA